MLGSLGRPVRRLSIQVQEALNFHDEFIQIETDQAQQLAGQIEKETSITMAEGLEINLWASDSLIQDPIAISIDPEGRIFYTQASRQGNSEFDIRGHRDWMTASISFQTVEDRRAFLRQTFTEDSDQSTRFLEDLNKDGVRDWKDLAVEKEQVGADPPVATAHGRSGRLPRAGPHRHGFRLNDCPAVLLETGQPCISD